MKKIIFALLFAIMTISIVSFAQTAEIGVYLETEQIAFDVNPQILNGRTMVPIRAIFEQIGAVVEWDETTKTVISSKGETVVKMTVDSTDMYINNEIVSMDVSPVVIDGRTLAPARYVAEAFGANVVWDAENNNVIISFENTLGIILYANDGRTISVPEEEVDAYLNVGWYKTIEETKQTLYAEDGRTISVFKAEVPAYLNVGWYETIEETKQMLYAEDGRTISVFKAEVPAYLNVGWYETIEETKQTLYAEDGRTISVFKAEVPAYLNVGWYETSYDAQQAKQLKITKTASSDSYNPGSDGYYYRTPTGKRYHLDPNCGGKNSYRTSNISGLSPCKKCAY